MCRQMSTANRRNPAPRSAIAPPLFVRYVGEVGGEDTLHVLPPESAEAEFPLGGRLVLPLVVDGDDANAIDVPGRGDGPTVSEWLPPMPSTTKTALKAGSFTKR